MLYSVHFGKPVESYCSSERRLTEGLFGEEKSICSLKFNSYPFPYNESHMVFILCRFCHWLMLPQKLILFVDIIAFKCCDTRFRKCFGGVVDTQIVEAKTAEFCVPGETFFCSFEHSEDICVANGIDPFLCDSCDNPSGWDYSSGWNAVRIAVYGCFFLTCAKELCKFAATCVLVCDDDLESHVQNPYSLPYSQFSWNSGWPVVIFFLIKPNHLQSMSRLVLDGYFDGGYRIILMDTLMEDLPSLAASTLLLSRGFDNSLSAQIALVFSCLKILWSLHYVRKANSKNPSSPLVQSSIRSSST